MRKILLLLMVFLSAMSQAQTPTKPAAPKKTATQTQVKQENEKPNPVEVIMNESNGNITIDIPESILLPIIQSMGGLHNPGKVVLKPGINRLTGFRIQVFSDGRNQSTLENRAKARGNLILSKFPKYRGQVYTFSNSPNWYTRIGNFRTSEEASNAMSELKQAFPSLSGEMRVVKSPIVLIRQ